MLDEELKNVNHFRYLRTVVKENGSMNGEIKHRASAEWEIRRSGALRDRKMPVELKETI